LSVKIEIYESYFEDAHYLLPALLGLHLQICYLVLALMHWLLNV